MADTTPSTNMSMPVPIVGQDPGPQWGSDLNSCLTILDAHDHSTGYGVQITPAGMNISSALTFANNPATNVQYLGLFVQSIDPTVNGTVYYKGSDLYFKDGAANVIRITQAGSVAGATGTITGLPSGTASASYGSSTFVFQSATNTAATIDGRDIILRNSTASSKGLTLSPPAAMGSDIAMTFPTLPASTLPMAMSAAGAMSTISYNSIADARTRTTGTTVAAGGVAISSGNASQNVAIGTLTDINGTSVTITTSGRPVQIMLRSRGTTGYIGMVAQTSAGSGVAYGRFVFDRTGTSSATVGDSAISVACPNSTSEYSNYIPPSSIQYVDAVSAGTYTYKLQAAATSFSGAYTTRRVDVVQIELVAYEL